MWNLSNCVVYDVEVAEDPAHVKGGWDNPEEMGFASAVAYDYETNQYEFFLGPEQLQALRDYLGGRVVVTFNGVKFDSRVILGNRRSAEAGTRWSAVMDITSEAGAGFKDYDLLLQYVRARYDYQDVDQAEARLGDKAIHDGTFGLDGLAEGTLGLRKSGHGAKAPYLYQEGSFGELLAYNLHDVRLTRMLFEFILAHGYLIDRSGRVVAINQVPFYTVFRNDPKAKTVLLQGLEF